jgi:uncharacterized repeat protein (TIGR01451 family)
MQTKLYALVGVGIALALAIPASAAADVTLGTTTKPTGPTTPMNEPCTGLPGEFGIVAQVGSDPSTSFTVPQPGGEITQWQTNVTGDTASAPLTLAVLRPTGGGNYTVVALDSETVPSSPPANNVATYSLPTPIAVQPGDVLGYEISSGSGTVTCAWSDAGSAPPTSIPPDDVVGVFLSQSALSAGSSITELAGEPATVLNLAANFVPATDDAGVTTSAGPSGAAAGQTVLLSSTVTNHGAGESTLTFTDSVPSGMTIDAAVAGPTACSTSGQTVTCTITGLASGQSVPVNVVVTPSSAGSYTNDVSVAVPSGVTDPNASNNSASASLSVGAFVPARCIVPRLKGTTKSLATTLLKDLGCKVRTGKTHSKSVKKGLVVRTKPGKGVQPYQTKVTLIVSSGPPRKHHHK